MKHICGVHHIALKASDFDRTREFYTRALGLKEVAAWGEGDGRAVMLDCFDGTCVELFAGGKKLPDGPFLHLAFRTEDCDAAYAAALAAGATADIPPKDVDIPAKPEVLPVRIAFVRGFDNELIEFFQLR